MGVVFSWPIAFMRFRERRAPYGILICPGIASIRCFSRRISTHSCDALLHVVAERIPALNWGTWFLVVNSMVLWNFLAVDFGMRACSAADASAAGSIAPFCPAVASFCKRPALKSRQKLQKSEFPKSTVIVCAHGRLGQ